MDHQKLIERITQRKKILNQASKNLKAYFVGLDEIIDKIMNNIETWFVLPEVISHPIIINLWGLTGVGKTDLVRRLVNEISFMHKFLEVQLEGKGESSQSDKSIQSMLFYSGIEENSPGILLLDEIQRFRTIDPDGSDEDNQKYNDIWTLLSDGKFQSDAKNRTKLIEMFLSDLYWEQESGEDDDEVLAAMSPVSKKKKKKKEKDKKVFNFSFWDARDLKRILRLPDSIENIMKWDKETRRKTIIEKLESNDICQGENYNKLLIFVSGNLDEAYSMAKHVDEADIEADIFYKFSKTINVIKIKEALSKRFKPEQISRLGNVHIIYPSLNTISYRTIIRRRIDMMIANFQKESGIKIEYDDTLIDLIYKNGVYPAQGVRPVFTTISSLLECNIPKFILSTLLKNSKSFLISFKGIGTLYATHKDSDNTIEEIRIDCELENLRRNKNINLKYLSGVHEAGHAVIYALMFNVVPTQIKCQTSSSTVGGMVFMHNINESKTFSAKRINVFLGGLAAEEIVFGPEMSTQGASHDLQQATDQTAYLFRKSGLMGSLSQRHAEVDELADSSNTDLESTNPLIEDFMQNAMKLTKEMLNNNIDLYKEVCVQLIENGELNPEEFLKIASKYLSDIKIVDNKETLYENFQEKYKKFIEK